MAILVFSGVDGAGKTTQIQLIEHELRSKGAMVVKFWARGGYTPLFSFMKRLVRKLRSSAMPEPGLSAARSQQFESSRLRKIWLLISILDLILCYGVWLRIKRVLGYTVICDRYIEDSLLDFNHNFPMERVESWWSWRALKAFTPKPNYCFMLFVPPEESARRSILKNEPFPDSVETLAWRYARYQEMAETGNWCTIDCQVSINEVHNLILEEVKL